LVYLSVWANFFAMLSSTWFVISHAEGSILELNAFDGSIFGTQWQYMAKKVSNIMLGRNGSTYLPTPRARLHVP
jgi:hypothetical protein